MAVASLVTGILGLVSFWLCGLGGLLGLVAVVLGVLGLQRAKQEPGEPQKGLAIAGIVTGALALVAGAVMVGLLFFGGATSTFEVLEDVDTTFQQGDIYSDPADGECDPDRFLQDPDC